MLASRIVPCYGGNILLYLIMIDRIIGAYLMAFAEPGAVDTGISSILVFLCRLQPIVFQKDHIWIWTDIFYSFKCSNFK